MWPPLGRRHWARSAGGMEPLQPRASDHSGSPSGSQLSSTRDEEKTAKVTGDGDNCVNSDWTKESPEDEDSEQDEDEDEKVTAAVVRSGGGKVQTRGVGPLLFWEAAQNQLKPYISLLPSQ